MIIVAGIRQLIRKRAFGVLLEKQRPERLFSADHCSRVSAKTVLGVWSDDICILLPTNPMSTQKQNNKMIHRRENIVLPNHLVSL